jgi:hypothetical protein
VGARKISLSDRAKIDPPRPSGHRREGHRSNAVSMRPCGHRHTKQRPSPYGGIGPQLGQKSGGVVCKKT